MTEPTEDVSLDQVDLGTRIALAIISVAEGGNFGRLGLGSFASADEEYHEQSQRDNQRSSRKI